MHNDHTHYFAYTTRSRLDKAVQSLLGILEGIAIDKKINQKELSFMSEWIKQHKDLKHRHPFNELLPVVYSAFIDGILTSDEKEDLLWLCEKMTGDAIYYDQITNDIQKLHGILGGIMADAVVTEKELDGLIEWLQENDHLKTCWPYDEIDSLVTSIMSDQKIDAEEHKILTSVFSDFVTLNGERSISSAPILEGTRVSGICAVCPDIKFNKTSFCFTGASSRYARSELEKIIVSLGGKFTNNVSKFTNYLIIGAEGNPCWAYACYGRKVEAAVNLRKEGCKIILVHENDFYDAVVDIKNS